MYLIILTGLLGLLLMYTFRKRNVLDWYRIGIKADAYTALLFSTRKYHRQLRYLGLFLVLACLILILTTNIVTHRIARMFSLTDSNECKTCNVYAAYHKRMGSEFDNSPAALQNFVNKCNSCDKSCREYSRIVGESESQCDRVTRTSSLARRNLERSLNVLNTRRAAATAFRARDTNGRSDAELLGMFPSAPTRSF